MMVMMMMMMMMMIAMMNNDDWIYGYEFQRNDQDDFFWNTHFDGLNGPVLKSQEKWAYGQVLDVNDYHFGTPHLCAVLTLGEKVPVTWEDMTPPEDRVAWVVDRCQKDIKDIGAVCQFQPGNSYRD